MTFKNPQTGKDFTVDDCLIMISKLCDTIKQLEIALTLTDHNERARCLRYVKEHRQLIEHMLLGKPKS